MIRLELSRISLNIAAMFGSSFLLDTNVINSFSKVVKDWRLEIIFSAST